MKRLFIAISAVALLSQGALLQAEEDVTNDAIEVTDTTATSDVADGGSEDTGSTDAEGTTTAKRPLSQALSSVEKNLENNPDNPGLLNAQSVLLRNQAKIEGRSLGDDDVGTDDIATERLSKSDKLEAKQARREAQFDRKTERMESRVARVEKVERVKVERPEKQEKGGR